MSRKRMRVLCCFAAALMFAGGAIAGDSLAFAPSPLASLNGLSGVDLSGQTPEVQSISAASLDRYMRDDSSYSVTATETAASVTEENFSSTNLGMRRDSIVFGGICACLVVGLALCVAGLFYSRRPATMSAGGAGLIRIQ